MKKSLVMTLVLVSTSFAFAAKSVVPKEMVNNHNERIREWAFGKGGSAKTLKDTVLDAKREMILDHMDLSPRDRSSLGMAINGTSDGARELLEQVVTLYSAKKVAAEIAKVDKDEATSIERSVEANVKLLIHSARIKDIAKPHTMLNESEAQTALGGYEKLTKLVSRNLVNFSKAERDSYSEIIEKFDKLNNEVSDRSALDNLVKAVMEVKGVTKEKALEILKKLIDCK